MSNLPDKFTIPNDRIPRPFPQGAIGACVAVSITKILEVINCVKTGEYIEFSKGYTYGRHNRPDKRQGGMDYEYALNSLLKCGSVPADMYTDYDEMPDIRDRLFGSERFHELEKEAEKTKIKAWEKIQGNIYKLDNIKKYLYEHQMPLVGNMTGNTMHCTVIVGYDGDKLLYQDHDVTGRIISIKHTKFNYAYYIDGGIDEMSNFKSYNIDEFKNYISTLNVSRRISLIQLHHTYSPSYKQFTGDNHIALQTEMRNYHIKTNGWSDIAQHFTIFPDGVIVSGRSMEMIPAGIKGANTGAVCIECLGNFDIGGDIMTDKQKETVVAAVKILIDKFGIEAKNGIAYHGWWTSGGTALGDYYKDRSVKTCPGTNFFGGNSRKAFEENLLPLIENYGKIQSEEERKAEEIKEIVGRLFNAGILSDYNLWVKKCGEDINVYWLCLKMANYLKTA